MSSSPGTQGSEHSSNTCDREVEREPGLSGTREATHKHQSRRVRVASGRNVPLSPGCCPVSTGKLGKEFKLEGLRPNLP